MRTLLAAVLVPAAISLAQTPAPAPVPARAVLGGSGGSVITTAAAGAGSVFYFRSEAPGAGGSIVTGIPYTADAVTTRSQTLADGNHITTTTTTHVARDSQGRTRREDTLPTPPGAPAEVQSRTVVFIHDPVNQVSYILEPDHTARKLPVPPPPPQAAGPTSAARAGFFTEALPAPTAIGRNQANTESLGSQILEGVQAEGTRTTTIIPAGQIGNEQPIVITDERWYSPDLKTVILTKHSDPRFGETTYQLTNIQRIEPPASLFEVPSDYTIAQPGDVVRRIPTQP
jgi:hypothetical protein